MPSARRSGFTSSWKLVYIAALVFLSGALCSAEAMGGNSVERDRCVQVAAAHYYRPSYPIPFPAFVDLVRAVLRQEAGCGLERGNSNQSVDVGCMQINSTHFSTLARWGITRDVLRGNDCQNIMVGVWILDSEISRGGELWKSVGNYNSRTRKYNERYQRNVWNQLQRLWAERLARR